MSERRPSYGAPNQPGSRLPRAEAAAHRPAAAHPPPATQLPPLPSEAYGGNSHASTSTSRYSQSSSRLPTSPDAYNDPGRQRGESSPISSRHYESGWNAAAADHNSRRTSSGTAPKRLVDGREETREERRVRKERDRAAREEHDTDSAASPTDSRRRSSRPNRSSGLPNSPTGADDLSNLSLGAPPVANAVTRTPSATSSKSVLTIALQRAQSAVLLDSANNVPAAIAAYAQSVRLLKEVMQRVEEGARREREKEAARGNSRNDPRPGETEEDFERRIAKAEKRDRAKQDEARRLRVIHDTYEDRIRMLQSVGDPTSETAPPESSHAGSSPSTPSTIHAHSPDLSAGATFAIEETPLRAPALTGRSLSITSLGTVSTPPATFHPVGEAPPPMLVVQQPTPARPREEAQAGEGIGHAMLSGSPPASPMDPRMPVSSRPPPSQSTLSGAGQRLAPGMIRRPSIADETIEEADESSPHHFDSRASISSDGTATSMSRTMTVAGVADPSTTYRSTFTTTPPSQLSQSQTYFADHEDHPTDVTSPAAVEGQMPRSESFKSTRSSASVDPAPVARRKQAFGWPSEEDEETEEVDDSRASSFVVSDATSPNSTMRRSDSGFSGASSMKRIASGDSMQRTASGDSVMSMRGSSIFGPGGFSQMSATQVPSAGDYHSPRYSTPLGLGHPSDLASRPRPGRSASLANTPTYVAAAQDSRRAPSTLVSTSTSLGTISQRRRSPEPSRTAGEHHQEDDQEALDQVSEVYAIQELPRFGERPMSQERTVPSEFGLALQAAGSGSTYSSASLPTRLRTQSQGGNGLGRPSLLSHYSDMPPVPSQLGVSERSTMFNRKGSIPGTVSGVNLLNAPPLGRSNSNSSQGSFSERNSRGDSPQLAYVPGHQSSSSISNSYSPSVGSETPTYSTFASRGAGSMVPSFSPPPPPLHSSATTQPVSSSRRPFHLMRQLVLSLETEGCYITPRLFVPRQIWTQPNSKLVAIETKVRMLDLLHSGLESVSKASSNWTQQGGSVRGFVAELDSFEGLMEGIQSTLSKKLGYGASGKKTGATSFASWSSKLSRSLDRVANGRSIDRPEVYSEVLAKVFHQAQLLDWHLGLLASPADSPYALISLTERTRIEQRLKRASDFFGQVILRFVIRDVGLMIDKYIKRSGTWVGE